MNSDRLDISEGSLRVGLALILMPFFPISVALRVMRCNNYALGAIKQPTLIGKGTHSTRLFGSRHTSALPDLSLVDRERIDTSYNQRFRVELLGAPRWLPSASPLPLGRRRYLTPPCIWLLRLRMTVLGCIE